MIRVAVTVGLAAGLVGCGAGGDPPTSSQPVPALDADRTETLGAKLSAEKYHLVADGVHEGPALAVADVLANPQEFVGKTLRLEGEIRQVCPKKGCWVNVGDEMRAIHVKFASGCDQYVPLDAAGRQIVIEGQLRPSPAGEELEHIREDAAGAGTPELRLSFVASGAALPK